MDCLLTEVVSETRQKQATNICENVEKEYVMEKYFAGAAYKN